MSYHGDIRLGDTIDIKACFVQSTGAGFTLAGSPVISAYVDNGTTEITAGITLSVDFDNRTGLVNVRVVASSGNGFATATNISLVVTVGTVNSVSVVGYEIGSFSIENRSALRPATKGRDLVVDSAGLADATAVKIGPTGAATAQTARDIGTSVLLSNGSGTGQVLLSSGQVELDATSITAILTALFADARMGLVTSGTLQAPGDSDQTHIKLASGASAIDNFAPYIGAQVVVVVDGVVNVGTATGYNGTTKFLQLDRALNDVTDNNDLYYIFAGSPGLAVTDFADAMAARHYRGGSNAAPTVADVLAHGNMKIDFGAGGDALTIKHSNGDTAIGPLTVTRGSFNALKSAS